MKFLLAFCLVLATTTALAMDIDTDSFHGTFAAATPEHPALHSFADVYRMTVVEARMGDAALLAVSDAPVRLAAAQAAPAPELQFSIGHFAEPSHWLLLLSGLSLAVWVARRRLGYFF